MLELFAATDVVIPPAGQELVATGVAIACPPGTYGRIAPRSGLALKHRINIGAGVIDPDYRGEVVALLVNMSADPFRVTAGDRIAQLVVERCSSCQLRVVNA